MLPPRDGPIPFQIFDALVNKKKENKLKCTRIGSEKLTLAVE